MTTITPAVPATAARPLRILVYKRTHVGDPDIAGRFGINHCMGSVRNYDYDAVIGVGGMGSEPQCHGIAGRITWIGVGPQRDWDSSTDPRGPLVTFERFHLWDSAGPPLLALAPTLARRMYEKKARVVVDLSPEEQVEAECILGLLDSHCSAPSQTWAAQRRNSRCGTVSPLVDGPESMSAAGQQTPSCPSKVPPWAVRSPSRTRRC